MYLNFGLGGTQCYYWTQNLGQPLKRLWDREHVSTGQKHYSIQAACEYAELHMNFYCIKEKG